MATGLVLASESALHSLYGSLCSANFSDGTNVSSCQTFVIQYFNNLSGSNKTSSYSSMANVLFQWLTGSAPQTSLGLPNSTTIPGLRIQIIDPDGKTSFDSNAGVLNNIVDNINVPGDNFPNDGKYIINENQNTRSYNMGAALSEQGEYFQNKWSSTVNAVQLYLAVRQGNKSKPLGNIVISMNA